MHSTTYIYMCMQIFVIFFKQYHDKLFQIPFTKNYAWEWVLFLLSFQTRRLNKGVSFKHHWKYWGQGFICVTHENSAFTMGLIVLIQSQVYYLQLLQEMSQIHRMSLSFKSCILIFDLTDKRYKPTFIQAIPQWLYICISPEIAYSSQHIV